MKIVTKSVNISGRTLSFEVGRVAEQAASAVLARYGDSVVLAAVTVGSEDNKKDHFPLSVEYQERLYSGGRIKGSRWIKRERNTDEEALSSRLIDRSIRPLFPAWFRNEVQVIVMVLATDIDNDTDVLGINAVSAAIAASPVPWSGPVGAVRIGLTDGQIITNPQNGNREGVDLDLVVSSTSDLIPMIEAGANQIPEDQVIAGITQGLSENKKIVSCINELVAEVGKTKLPVKEKQLDPSLVSQVESSAQKLIDEFITSASLKEGSSVESIIASVSENLDEKQKKDVPAIIEAQIKKTIRRNLLEKSLRPDGRKLDEIRPLHVEVGVLPRVHGSAIFQRGQTQALTVSTLGAPSLSQTLESAEGEAIKRYIHHYNFPPFSTGETGRVGAPKRREIGHGALAERALAPVIPPETQFPYAIRLVSEILSSNGSTSMASTCGSTLSLMDAGVPILAPVAGISTGLVTPDDYPLKANSYKLLTDIIGLEDHYTDMDFKVAGTTKGITAIQLDVKVPGLTLDICKGALERAKTARLQILDAMLKVLPHSRPELSSYAPKISTATIPVDKIGELIGPGGKNIKKLMADTQTDIDVRDDGSVFVSGTDSAGVGHVLSYLQAMTKEVAAGEIYEGTVARIQPFGAFVTILPGKDGLVHVSQMAQGFVSDPNQMVHVGQVVRVWVTEVDPQGKIALSMLFDESGSPIVKAHPPRSSGPFSAPLSSRGPDRRRPSVGRRRF